MDITAHGGPGGKRPDREGPPGCRCRSRCEDQRWPDALAARGITRLGERRRAPGANVMPTDVTWVDWTRLEAAEALEQPALLFLGPRVFDRDNAPCLRR